MAYMSQEKKKALAPEIKRILAKHGLKGSLSVKNHMELSLTISEGPIDFWASACKASLERWGELPHGKGDYFDVNPYHAERQFDGYVGKVAQELVDAMNVGNHNRSQPQIDYFDVGWYISINIGRWNKPYQLQI